jgi:hypothetical protein
MPADPVAARGLTPVGTRGMAEAVIARIGAPAAPR